MRRLPLLARALRALSALSALGALGALGAAPAGATPALSALGALDQLLPWEGEALGEAPSVAASHPAGLSWTRARSSFSLTFVRQELSLRYLERPASADVPASVYDARAWRPGALPGPLPRKPAPTAALPARALSADGLQQALLGVGLQGAPLDGALRVGVYALLPLHRFELQSPAFVDERAQHFGNSLKFERWGDALEGLSATAALAYALTPALSVGAGVSMSTSAVASSDVFMPSAGVDAPALISPRVEVSTALSAFGSVEARRRLLGGEGSLYASAHAPESSEVRGEGAARIWGYPYPEGQDSIPQSFANIYRMLPLRARAGAAWRAGGADAERWGLTASAGWARWSRYLNRAGEAAGWSDQWDASAGAWRRGERLDLGLDARYRPSPAPEQVGRASYVDPSQLAVAAGLSWRLRPGVTFVAQAQGHRLLPREDRKDPRAADPVVDELPAAVDPQGAPLAASEGLQTNNPGYPGYRSEGWVWVGTIGVRLEASAGAP